MPAEWQRRSFVIPPQSTEKPMRLAIRLENDGQLDIDQLSLFSLTGQDLNHGLHLPSGNAFPISSFPNGLPGGWSIRRGSAVTDPDTPGPSGLPSLRISGGRRTQFSSAPIAVPGQKRMILSLDAKGSASGQKVSVQIGPPEKMSTQSLTLTNEWKRYELRFRPDYPLNGFMIVRFISSQNWNLDRIRLADRGGEFKAAHPTEVTVNTEQAYALWAENEEPRKLNIVVQGTRPQGSELRIRLEDPQRRLTPLISTSIPAGSDMWVYETTWNPPYYAPYGSFRIEAEVVDREGAPLSAVTEFIVHRVRNARYLHQDAPDSPFGIHILPTDVQAETVKKLGFNWMRTHDGSNHITKWYELEKTKGALDFSKADASVRLLRRHHLMILGLLDTSPPFYSNFAPETRSGGYYKDALWIPTDLEAWSQYTAKTVSHFKGRIDHWEVWNEPYVGMFFTREYQTETKRRIKGTPDDYLPLLAHAYSAAKDANPDATVFWSTGPFFQPGKTFHQRAVELEADANADALTFHLYSTRMMGSPDDLIGKKHREYTTGHALHDAELWNTEGGPGATFNHPYRHLPLAYRADDVHHTADHAVRYYVSCLAHGVDKFFLYTFHGWGDWKPQWSLMNQDGTLPHLATALSNLFWHLEDCRFKEWEALADNRGWIARFHRKDGRTVDVILPTSTLNHLPDAVDLYGNPWHPASPHTAKTAIRVRP